MDFSVPYLSCFSGVGGLEGSAAPIAVCDSDPFCQAVLQRRFPKAKLFVDVKEIQNTKANILVGGWPCQDLSIAGRQKGLSGRNSKLFYDFVHLAASCKSETLIAENVTNLLRLEGGAVFLHVLEELREVGFPHIAWRTLNAREFGLPHHRNRVFIIASKRASQCFSLFRRAPEQEEEPVGRVAGFYWTAGTHSICYSPGYVPTLKIGSAKPTPVISPPAIHRNDQVRLLNPDEALRLQGLSPKFFENIPDYAKYKMAGNAVASPVGKFVVDGALNDLDGTADMKTARVQGGLFGSDLAPRRMPENGYCDGSIHEVVLPQRRSLAKNLDDFIDGSDVRRLNARQASGLLKRLDRSGAACPDSLRAALDRCVSEAGVE